MSPQLVRGIRDKVRSMFSELQSLTCICGHSRGTLTKPVGFKFQCGAVVSTGIAILPELRSLGLNLVGRSLYDVEGFSHEIPPGFGLSTPIPKSLPLRFVVSMISFISLADDTRRKALFHLPPKTNACTPSSSHWPQRWLRPGICPSQPLAPGSVTSSDRTLSI
jgi:hypothetical protein